MKKFNLEEAKAGKPVCTRDGRDVVIIDYNYKCTYTYDGDGGALLLIGKVIQEDGTELAVAFYQDGRERQTQDGVQDLFMKSEKCEGWCWLTHNNDYVSINASVYETMEKALSHKPDRVESFLAKVEWEE